MKTIRTLNVLHMLLYVICFMLHAFSCLADIAYQPHLTPKKIYIGDMITYKVTVPYDRTTSLSIPMLSFTSGGNSNNNSFEIITPSVTVHGNKLKYMTRITPFQTGAITFPTFNIQENVVRSLSCTISSLITGTPNARPMKRPINPYSDIFILATLFFFIAGNLFLYHYLKDQLDTGALSLPFIKKHRTPLEIWQEYHDYFSTLVPPAQADVKMFYIETSEKLKKFFLDLSGRDLMDRTTSEIAKMIDIKDIPVKDHLIGLLNEADLVKFAKYRPEANDDREYIRHAQDIIERMKPAQTITDPQEERVP